MKLAISLLLVAFALSGCVYAHVATAQYSATYWSVGKDIKLDPNGVTSVVSNNDTGIIGAIGGAIAGWFLHGG